MLQALCHSNFYVSMATIDEILGVSSPNGGGNAQAVDSIVETTSSTETGTSGSENAGENGIGEFEQLYRQLNPYTPPTAEDVEKEKKKQRRDELFAAIGDGISALSNLYFTSQYAPNMYTGKNTMSERTRIRYDKLLKDRDEKKTAYFNGIMRARQADAENAHRERSWQRQLGLDQEARERYKKELEYRKDRDQVADNHWQATFDEDKRREDRNYNFQVQQHNDNVAARREQAAATRASGVRGKQLGFSDGKGNQVAIYESVWKGSMPQVYDAMLQDLDPTEATRLRRKLDTSQKIENYVKQNWHKSSRARAIMLALSGIDPATMTSEVSDDDVIDYVPGK